jgi:hypothetical protein
MPAKRAYGMDQDFYPWSPIVARPVLRWPDNARVALAVIVNLEHWDWEVPDGTSPCLVRALPEQSTRQFAIAILRRRTGSFTLSGCGKIVCSKATGPGYAHCFDKTTKT